MTNEDKKKPNALMSIIQSGFMFAIVYFLLTFIASLFLDFNFAILDKLTQSIMAGLIYGFLTWSIDERKEKNKTKDM